MNVSIYLQTAYENKHNWTLGENKPNSNPIKPNCLKAKMDVNSILTKDYERNDIFAVPENKANSNPNKPNCLKTKMDVTIYVIKEYENETAFRLQKYKPNQTQTNPISKQLQGKPLSKDCRTISSSSTNNTVLFSTFFCLHITGVSFFLRS